MKYFLVILVGLAFLSFSIWAHHMLMAGVNPFISNFFVIPLILIFLVGIVYLKKGVKGILSSKPYMLFSFGFIFFLIYSAFSYLFFENSGIDIQLNDTYLVIAYFHLPILIAFIFGFFGITYFMIDRVIKRKLNVTLGKIHFWSTITGIFLLLYLVFNIGMSRVPRRYFSFEGVNDYDQFANTKLVICVILILLLLSQILFLANLMYSLFGGPEKQ